MADELTEYEKIVKNYLDRQTGSDEALKAVYVPSKIKDCFKYITEEARKKAVNNCAMVSDEQVYKWARDYYFDVLPKESDKEATEAVQKLDEAEKEADKSSESTAEVLKKADEVLAKDRNGQLLFEF